MKIIPILCVLVVALLSIGMVASFSNMVGASFKPPNTPLPEYTNWELTDDKLCTKWVGGFHNGMVVDGEEFFVINGGNSFLHLDSSLNSRCFLNNPEQPQYISVIKNISLSELGIEDAKALTITDDLHLWILEGMYIHEVDYYTEEIVGGFSIDDGFIPPLPPQGGMGDRAESITSDGDSLWILDDHYVYLHHFTFEGVRIDDGFSIYEQLNQFPNTGGAVQSITTDGENLWVLAPTGGYRNDDIIVEFDKQGNVIDSFEVSWDVGVWTISTESVINPGDALDMWVWGYNSQGETYHYTREPITYRTLLH